MINQDILEYIPANDYLQTRVRHPRKVPPNFALYCDWLIWDSKHVYIGPPKAPKTIYVRSDKECLLYFIDDILPLVENRFILITSSHDTTIPLGFNKKYGLEWRKIVDNKHLTYWFTENRDLIHPKIKPLALGIPHPDLPSWLEMENDKTIWSEFLFSERKKWINHPKKQKIFGCWYTRVDHSSGTCPQKDDERTKAYSYLINKPDIFDWHPPGLERLEFIRKLGEYQFVLCPHGGGLDPNPKCWESLLMHAIPIVKRNTMSEALAHLPVVITDDWDEINAKTLNEWRLQFADVFTNNNLKYYMSNDYYFTKIRKYLQG